MAILKRFELVRVTCSTTSTGPLSLGAAVPGYLTFPQAGAVDGDLVSYSIRDGVNSEVGSGLLSSGATVLTRNVIKSTNADAAINLTGSAEVFCGVHAADFGTGANQALLLDDTGKIPNSGNILANVVPIPQMSGVLTSNTAIVAADRGKVIRGTGNWTLAHSVTAATAGNGFRYTISNQGSSTIVIDPAGSETIDGGATLRCHSKQQFDVVCDGSNWFTVGRQNKVLLSQQVVSSLASVQFSLPPDYVSFDLDGNSLLVTAQQSLGIQFATDGVPTFIATAIYNSQQLYGIIASAGAAGTIGQGLGTFAFGPLANQTMNFFSKIAPGIAGTAAYPSWITTSSDLHTSVDVLTGLASGIATIPARATHFQLFTVGSALFSGTFTLWGNARL